MAGSPSDWSRGTDLGSVERMDLPPKTPDLIHRRGRLKLSGVCARPNCRQPAQVTLAWDDAAVINYCAVHAEDKAGGHEVRVLWLQEGWSLCQVCHRVIPTHTLRAHFNTRGQPCPPAEIPDHQG